MPCAEIITIGTELLLGEIVDTNTRTLALALRSLGIDLYRTVTIGDNVERIAQSIRDSLARADIIITTGGLGPTVDDPTRQAVALAVGVDMEYREELWQQIVERIAKYGRVPSENQKRQAYIPKGALAVYNPVGTAPSFIVEVGRKAVISLPGVPREMETLLAEAVIPYLQKHFDLQEVIQVRVLHTSGIGEGIIDEKVGDLEESANPTVGLAAHSGIVDVRITAKAGTAQQAAAMIAEMEAKIHQRLGSSIFGTDNETLEQVVLQGLDRRGWSLAAIESGCGGLLARRLSGREPSAIPVIISQGLSAGSLPQAVADIRSQHQAHVALGVTLLELEKRVEVDICLLTPAGSQSRCLTYGGHPKNAPRWATNMALDWLRLETAQA